MAKKELQPKQLFEREYVVPLRRGWLKVPKYKRGNKAVKTLKEFIARHMKIYDRDLNKVKVDVNLNNELRFRGIKKPPAKIKVRAKKFDNDFVNVELVNLPKHIEFKIKREEKLKRKQEKKEDKKVQELKEENKKVDLESVKMKDVDKTDKSKDVQKKKTKNKEVKTVKNNQ